MLGRIAGPAGALGLLILNWPFQNGMMGGRAFDMPALGWRLLRACLPAGGPIWIAGVPYSGPDTHMLKSSTNPGVACTLTGQVPDNNISNDLPDNILSDVRFVAFGPHNQGTVGRMQAREQWVRDPGPAQQSFAPPIPQRAMMPELPAALPWPQVDPLLTPYHYPYPYPRPIPYRAIPYRVPHPIRSPQEQPVRGPSVSPAPRPGPKPRPSEVPALVWEFTPGGRTRPHARQRLGRHRFRPPTSREREKKHAMGINGASRLGVLLGLATEFTDVLEVAWDSLPWHIRKQLGSKPTVFEKLEHILWNLDQIKPGSFVAGFISETLEDKAFGKLGKIGAKAVRSAYDTGYLPKGARGFETGPGDQPVGPANARGGAGDLNRDPVISWLDDQLAGLIP